MFRCLAAALILLSATPAFAGIATTTMGVGVIVLPASPPAPPPPPPQPEQQDQQPGH